MTRWEYKLISAQDVAGEGGFKGRTRETVEAYLNRLGAEGWEVINVDFPDGYENPTRFSAAARREKA
jgi:hypothetical protein